MAVGIFGFLAMFFGILALLCSLKVLYDLKTGKIKPRILVGDIYQDCSYHPVLCTESDGDDIAGISLVDFSEPRSCSIKHCGVRRLGALETARILRCRDSLLACEKYFHELTSTGQLDQSRNPYAWFEQALKDDEEQYALSPPEPTPGTPAVDGRID